MPSAKTESEQTHDKDFVAIAKTYAKKALDKKNCKRFGIWIRLAAQRFLDDLERAKKKGAPFKFDAWHANDVCDFAEKLPHVEGVWETPTIVLHESHVFFLVQLFGFRKQDGTRRFSKALFAVARKNAKSTLAAIVGLYCQNCEGENGPQIITGATTGQQARIVFNVAKRMVEKTSDLREAFGLVPFANAIASNWNAVQTVQRLKQAGVPLELFRQGPQSYHPAMQDLELHYMAGRLAHGNDAVLNWNASNLVARQDQNLNNAPDKRKSTEKIDDMAALLMATGVSLTAESQSDMDGFLKFGIKAGR